MFGRKHAQVHHDTETCLRLLNEWQDQIVACSDCRHLIFRRDAQVVEITTVYYRFWTAAWPGKNEALLSLAYYCPSCRVPYDRAEHYGPLSRQVRYLKRVPAEPEGWVELDGSWIRENRKPPKPTRG